MLRTKSDGGFTGYAGGIRQVALDLQLQSAHFRMDATKQRVLAVGGNFTKTSNGGNQYQPKLFAQPLVKRMVAGGASRLVAYLTDKKQGKPTALAVADQDDLLKYIPTTMTGWYYYHWLPDNDNPRVKCFLDIDWELKHEDWEVSYDCLQRTIERINAALQLRLPQASPGALDYVVCGGVRYGKPGLAKHSYHVTWLHQQFTDMQHLRSFIKTVFTSAPVIERPDFTVYTKARPMRMPWSQKSGDPSTVLIPLRPPEAKRAHTKQPISSVYLPVSRWDLETLKKFDFTPRHWEPSTVVHSHADQSVRSHYSAQPGEEENKEICDDIRNNQYIAFFEPLRIALVSAIQSYRHKQLAGENVSGPGVPTAMDGLLTCSEFEPTDKEGTFIVRVNGDSFCEYDAPNHHHSTGDKICLSIDLAHGYYNQLCYACTPSGASIKKYNIFGPNCFTCSPMDRRIRGSPLHIEPRFGTHFFHYSLQGQALYHADRRELYVYNSKSKIWLSGAPSRITLHTLRRKFADDYRGYLSAAHHPTFLMMLDGVDLDTPKGRKKSKQAEKQYQMAQAVECFKDINDTHFKESIVNAIAAGHDGSNPAMDLYPELIPMSDGNCYNVFTGEQTKRTKEMRCTSFVAGAIDDSTDEDEDIIRAWLYEIACDRPDLTAYIKMICAYSLTFLTHDRHFYMNIGHGRNGKSTLMKLLKALTSGNPCRHALLQSNFFQDAANKKKSSEGATSSLVSTEDKSLYVVEELGTDKVDSSLIKQIASNETFSGRQLYGEQKTLTMNGKLMVNLNHFCEIDGEDEAIWDRLVVLPFDARYVIQGEKTDKDQFRYDSDSKKSDHIETLTSAFLSVCTKELTAYYKINGHEKSFPVPRACGEKQMKQKEQNSPLFKFFAENVRKTEAKEEYGKVKDLFDSLMMFSKEGRRRIHTTMEKFIASAEKAGYTLTIQSSDQSSNKRHCSVQSWQNSTTPRLERYFKGFTLTKEAMLSLAQSRAPFQAQSY